jgi:hypothetical protein
MSALPEPPHATHLVLIPSYNSGRLLAETVDGARRAWPHVWVVVDGSTDGSEASVLARAAEDPGLRVLRRPRNSGKGAAVLDGLLAASAARFSHVLTMDADLQHSADCIARFMRDSARSPEAMILGVPQFGPEAPLLRVYWRRLSNWATMLETGGGIGDSLFGFRVYPIAPLLSVMTGTRWMRRYDFDAEAAVRLCWEGVKAVNVPVPVRYFSQAEGGVSHFRYGRDNVLLARMHLRLMAAKILRVLSAQPHPFEQTAWERPPTRT